ncbi:cobalamin biosynthesis protein CobG [Streptomyces sp. GMY02]|uniref:cobalamin biosynthesis protein CobG n=1 Tax=Streptomyces sp. GMY02 TaxID=1333528 RepID=UPI0020B832DB|nr:cobalamin biosynthesis protein CobG [Streptomyces sp. GMY02]
MAGVVPDLADAAGPVREGGDACPGALRLHTADDGRLARLRLPAGLLTYRQAETLASAAERLGDGHLDITSRGNVQLRGLGAACGDELATLLRQAGLLPSERHERIRNIVASPLSGLDGYGHGHGDRLGDGYSDRHGDGYGDGRGDGHGVGRGDGRREVGPPSVQLWARELDGLLCASEPSTALSGRFLFALDDGRGDVAALGADVTLLARRDGTAMVRTGANRAGLLVPAADAPRAALLAAETFLTVAETGGSGAWRVQELPPGHGLDRAVAARLADAGITAGYAAEMPVIPATATATPAATAAAGAGAEPPAPGVIRSPDGTVALSVYAPLGRLSAAQWRLLTTAGGEAAGGRATGHPLARHHRPRTRTGRRRRAAGPSPYRRTDHRPPLPLARRRRLHRPAGVREGARGRTGGRGRSVAPAADGGPWGPAGLLVGLRPPLRPSAGRACGCGRDGRGPGRLCRIRTGQSSG